MKFSMLKHAFYSHINSAKTPPYLGFLPRKLKRSWQAVPSTCHDLYPETEQLVSRPPGMLISVVSTVRMSVFNRISGKVCLADCQVLKQRSSSPQIKQIPGVVLSFVSCKYQNLLATLQGSSCQQASDHGKLCPLGRISSFL